MFDIGLASSLNKALTDYYDRATRRPHIDFHQKMANNRYNAILAGIKAWNAAASQDKCKSSAKLAGVFPFNPEKVLSGPLIFY
jgi:hypothetical protein